MIKYDESGIFGNKIKDKFEYYFLIKIGLYTWNISKLGGDFIRSEYLENEYLTKEDLLLLHLYDHVCERGKYAISISLTMQEIKKEIKCTLGYLSRLLNINIKKGFIRRKLIKFPNKHRRLNVFLLTKKGRKMAKELYEYATRKKI